MDFAVNELEDNEVPVRLHPSTDMGVGVASGFESGGKVEVADRHRVRKYQSFSRSHLVSFRARLANTDTSNVPAARSLERERAASPEIIEPVEG